MLVYGFCTVLLCCVLHTSEGCNGGNFFSDAFLGARTPYRMVGNQSFGRLDYEGCTPQKIWMLVRHGTRNPSAGHIDLMRERLPEIRDKILEKVTKANEFIKNRDLDLFRKWRTKLERDDEKRLVHEGEDEMILLAERMQSRFPTIFDSVYSNTTYKFKYTYSQRTRKSALNFATGLFGRLTAKEVWFPTPSKKDPILRFYKNCDRWNTEIKKNPEAMKEVAKFDFGPAMKQTLKSVSSRLGLDGELTVDDIKAMYVTCAFETAWNKLMRSPWCSVFNTEELKVLEYAEDLKYYWQDGYGFELTYEQACPAFGDMINVLSSKLQYPKSIVYFTHSGTILKMLAHIGLYKDDGLTSGDFDAKKDNRQWRTGKIDSFGSNLAFVAFNCGGKKKILTLHQENVIRLPSCPDSDLCDISTINDYYTKSLNSCNFDVMCRISK